MSAGSTKIVVGVDGSPSSRTALRWAVRQVTSRVAEGHPAKVLIDATAGADLLVVGNRGHGTFTDALLGSVGQYCIHHAHCPVLVMRGETRRVAA